MPDSDATPRRPAAAVLAADAAAGAAGASLAGLWVAVLTLRLNPHLHASPPDPTVLLVLFGALAGLVGAGVGLLVGLAVLGLGRLVPRPVGVVLETAARGALAAAPVLYALLLPDSGIAGRALTDLLFGTSGTGAAFAVAGLGLAAAVAGTAVLLTLRAFGRSFGSRATGPLAGLLWGVAAASLVWAGLASAPPEARLAAARADDDAPASAGAPGVAGAPPEAAGQGAEPPPRLVLLVTDGADLSVLGPLVEAGELPTFGRLMAEGTWGPLASLEPALSPVVWTTLATGRHPAEHGVHQFTYFQLPGLEGPVYSFPLHTGLNFRLFPLLEALPWELDVRRPYTSSMRRTEALWTIVGRTRPVGVYQWLVTWPAEPVEGFMVSGGFGWVQYDDGGDPAEARAIHPPGALDGLGLPPRRPPEPAELAPYVVPGTDLQALDRHDERLALVRRQLGDPTGPRLERLVARFDPLLVMAAFYSVDPFHHLFARDRTAGGPFAPAIDARYRETDRRLGELLAALEAGGEPFHLVLVSDHGYDFENDHHTWGPPGVFFGLGPAFAPGRRVDSLSVFDIAPLALHLLGLPLAGDMPGTATGAYREALAGPWLRTHPVGRVATYETSRPGAVRGETSPLDAEIEEALKSLGYIE